MKFSKRVLLKLKNKNKKLKPEKYKKLKRESLRGLIKGNLKRPRLSVYRSNQNLYAQIIDDRTSTTVVSCSTLDREIKLFAPNQLLNWRVDTFFKKNLKILNVWIILKKRKFNFF